MFAIKPIREKDVAVEFPAPFKLSVLNLNRLLLPLRHLLPLLALKRLPQLASLFRMHFVVWYLWLCTTPTAAANRTPPARPTALLVVVAAVGE